MADNDINGNGRIGRVQKLGQTFQNLSERIRGLARSEPSTAWAYFLLGMSFAHEWDAGRVREAFDPSVEPQQLPDLTKVTQAYESIISMITQVSNAIPEPQRDSDGWVFPDPASPGRIIVSDDELDQSVETTKQIANPRP